MRRPIAASLSLGAALLLGLVPSASASSPSCTAQFVSGTAQAARPFGQTVVVPEVNNLTLGGPNLGQEVKVFFATADKTACPIL